jgi:hypothetical protein
LKFTEKKTEKETMMRITVFILSMLFLVAGSQVSYGESWFDMENCAICKPLLEQDPHLMHHMTWKHHNISDGLVSVTVIEPEYLPSYEKATRQMNAVIEKMQAGEEIYTCNMCTELGGIFQAGANMESVESDNVRLSIMTSDNPEMVERIQAWGTRTNKEMMATMEMEKASR